jgi:hypothetical protein
MQLRRTEIIVANAACGPLKMLTNGPGKIPELAGNGVHLKGRHFAAGAICALTCIVNAGE